MLKPVKEFIEYNIDIIEKEDWNELFLNWYAYRHDYYFDDMMEALETAFPNIWKITQEARATILENVTISGFSNLSYKSKRVTFENITQKLNSLFGFEGQDLIDVLDQAAKQAGLYKATNGWFRL